VRIVNDDEVRWSASRSSPREAELPPAVFANQASTDSFGVQVGEMLLGESVNHEMVVHDSHNGRLSQSSGWGEVPICRVGNVTPVLGSRS